MTKLFSNVLDATEFKQRQYHSVFPVAIVPSKCCFNPEWYDLHCEILWFSYLCLFISHAKSHVFVYAICSEVLPASCQRSIFTLAMSMLAFAGKVCQITELSDLLRCFSSSKVSLAQRILRYYVLFTFHTKYFMLYLLYGFFMFLAILYQLLLLHYLANVNALVFHV